MIPAVASIYLLPFILTKANAWNRICDAHLIKGLFIKRSINLKLLKLLTFIMFTCFSVALSGPSFYKVRVKAMKNRIPTILVIDLSASMQVGDVKPNRAAVAGIVAKRLLEKIKGAEVALVVYSDEPYRIVPITEDVQVIGNLLPLLNTKIMPTFGSRPDRALLLAYDMIANSGQKAGHIILLTDGLGDVSDKVINILKDSYYTDIYVSVVGIGTERGAPIPRFDTGFVKGEDGKLVISKLERTELEKAARYGKGYYMNQDISNFEMKRLLGIVSDKIWSSQNEDAEQSADGGYWFMLPLLLIIPFFFRRTVMNAVLIAWLLYPHSAFAGFKNWWFNGNQIGIFHYKRKEYMEAAANFTDHHLKAAALVNAGSFEAAVAEAEADASFEAFYNIGTMLAKVEQYSLAKKLLKKAVDMDPTNEDAYINYEIVKRLDDNDDDSDGDGDGDSDNNNDQNNQNNDSENPNNDGNSDSDKNDNQQNDQQNDGESDQEGQGGAGKGSGSGDGSGSGSQGSGQGEGDSGSGNGGSNDNNDNESSGGGSQSDDKDDKDNSDDNSSNGGAGGNGGGQSGSGGGNDDNSDSDKNKDNNNSQGSGGSGGSNDNSGGGKDQKDDNDQSSNNNDDQNSGKDEKNDQSNDQKNQNDSSSSNQNDKGGSDDKKNDDKNSGGGNGGEDKQDSGQGGGSDDKKNNDKNSGGGNGGENNQDSGQGGGGSDDKKNDDKNSGGGNGGDDKKDDNKDGAGGKDDNNAGDKDDKGSGGSDKDKKGSDGSDDKDDKSDKKQDKSDAKDDNDGKKDEEGNEGESDSEKDDEDPEKKNAREKLKKFPDDPYILLKNKMMHQYRQQRYGKDGYEKNPW